MKGIHQLQTVKRKLLFGGILSAVVLSSAGPAALAARAGSLQQTGSGKSEIQVETTQAATAAASGTTTRVNTRSGNEANNLSAKAYISATGKFVAFSSLANNLDFEDTNGFEDTFVADQRGTTIERVSVATDGTQANRPSYPSSISGDGRFVVFSSTAGNLVSGDTNGVMDVFLRDRVAGTTVRVSQAADGTQANNRSINGYITVDGRFLVFASDADNLVTGDTNGFMDIFVRDMQNGSLARIGQPDGPSLAATISTDGRFLAFSASAPSLVNIGDNHPHQESHAYLYDRQTNSTSWVDFPTYYDPNGPGSCCGGLHLTIPLISENGNFVAFTSDDQWLMSNDNTSGMMKAYVFNRQTGNIERVDVATDGTLSNADSEVNSISGDGRYLAFWSGASNLVNGDSNNTIDVFLRDRQLGITERVSLVDTNGDEGNGASAYGTVSDDGLYIAFSSLASNLVNEDLNGFNDIFVRCRFCKPWTLMFYLDGDNDLEHTIPPVMNQLEAAAGNPDVNTVAIWDQYFDDGTDYYELQPDANLNSLANYINGTTRWPQGELNMGDGQTLVNFVNWARQNYPADRYALILKDHGGGLGGAMWDSTSNHDFLNVSELGSAFHTVSEQGDNKLDVLFIDACLMGMLEDGFEFSSYVQFYVASENLGYAYPEPYYYYVQRITTETTPEEMARIFVEEYVKWGLIHPNISVTMSVADLSKAGRLVLPATNALASLLKNDMGTYAPLIDQALQFVQRFDENGNEYIDDQDDYIDLYDFAYMLQSISNDPQLNSATNNVMAGVNDYIRENRFISRDVDLSHSHGVSIFFPATASSFYNDSNYSFAAGAIWGWEGGSPMPGMQNAAANTVEWGPMLVSYFQTTQPGGPDNPNMPLPVPQLLPTYEMFLPVVVR